MLSQKLMAENNFELDNLIGFDLHKKTVGVIGTEKIGFVFSKIMNGFGCKVLAFDVNPNHQLESEFSDFSYTTFEEICRKSDIISIHCPLNASTKHLFNESKFSIIKKGAIIINTARGGIIHTQSLLNALDSNIISMAGLDV